MSNSAGMRRNIANLHVSLLYQVQTSSQLTSSSLWWRYMMINNMNVMQAHLFLLLLTVPVTLHMPVMKL